MARYGDCFNYTRKSVAWSGGVTVSLQRQKMRASSQQDECSGMVVRRLYASLTRPGECRVAIFCRSRSLTREGRDGVRARREEDVR